MSIFLGFLLILAIGGLVYLGIQFLLVRATKSKLEDQLHQSQLKYESRLAALHKELAALSAENQRLAKWKGVADADAKAAQILQAAKAELEQAEADAGILLRDAEHRVREMRDAAEQEASATSSEARQAKREPVLMLVDPDGAGAGMDGTAPRACASVDLIDTVRGVKSNTSQSFMATSVRHVS